MGGAEDQVSKSCLPSTPRPKWAVNPCSTGAVPLQGRTFSQSSALNSRAQDIDWRRWSPKAHQYESVLVPVYRGVLYLCLICIWDALTWDGISMHAGMHSYNSLLFLFFTLSQNDILFNPRALLSVQWDLMQHTAPQRNVRLWTGHLKNCCFLCALALSLQISTARQTSP